MMLHRLIAPLASCWALLALSASICWSEERVAYEQAAPLLRKYCEGCHNDQDHEGEFSVSSYQRLMQGGSRGAAVLAGDADISRLWRLVSKQSEPAMPPADSAQPAPEELQLLKQWITDGAKGPDGAEPPRQLITPHIEPSPHTPPAVTAVAWSPAGQQVAAARFGRVELYAADDLTQPLRVWGDLPGKINRLRFSSDGALLIVASGIAGLRGEARLLDIQGDHQQIIPGHRDTMYDAVLTSDGRVLATASYDHTIQLWDAAQGAALRGLSGHNGAVFSLAFHPQGQVLASASADETVKIWRTSDGERLDTLSQPQGEQYATAFSPDGSFVCAAGADNRIRIWRLVSIENAAINPLIIARFAHEAPIIRLAYSADGKRLASAAADRTIKVWDSSDINEIVLFPPQDAPVADLDLDRDGSHVLVGRLDGALQILPVTPEKTSKSASVTRPSPVVSSAIASALAELSEAEPNDQCASAQRVTAPCRIIGAIDSDNPSADVDVFRFAAEAGQTWMIEVDAARQKSPLDSHLAILDSRGQRVPRVLLQAVRDSYFTFRGKDSQTSDDFRLQNWQEMELNEYLYCNGEVVKLWMYPRGPDSGFKVYPGEGQRYGYFDTTPLAHALNEPCYIVEPHRPGVSLIPNGLPAFLLYYENDDDALRQWGADSRLMFTAPIDGDYGLRLADVRGFQGADFRYQLTIRPARPDFELAVEGLNVKIPAGAGREFSLRVQRQDGFEGPVRVEIHNTPPGMQIPSPIVIQAGQLRGFAQVRAASDAKSWTSEELAAIEVVAAAEIGGQTVSRQIANPFAKLEVTPAPPIQIMIQAETTQPAPPAGADQGPLILTIRPGATISALIRLQRQEGFQAPVSFGREDSGRNLPHGGIVDNIGLNGLLLLEGQSEREFFLTASPITEPGEYWFHLKADIEGGLTSPPILLRVER